MVTCFNIGSSIISVWEDTDPFWLRARPNAPRFDCRARRICSIIAVARRISVNESYQRRLCKVQIGISYPSPRERTLTVWSPLGWDEWLATLGVRHSRLQNTNSASNLPVKPEAPAIFTFFFQVFRILVIHTDHVNGLQAECFRRVDDM